MKIKNINQKKINNYSNKMKKLASDIENEIKVIKEQLKKYKSILKGKMNENLLLKKHIKDLKIKMGIIDDEEIENNNNQLNETNNLNNEKESNNEENELENENNENNNLNNEEDENEDNNYKDINYENNEEYEDNEQENINDNENYEDNENNENNNNNNEEIEEDFHSHNEDE